MTLWGEVVGDVENFALDPQKRLRDGDSSLKLRRPLGAHPAPGWHHRQHREIAPCGSTQADMGLRPIFEN